jgi:hypothetical protein
MSNDSAVLVNILEKDRLVIEISSWFAKMEVVYCSIFILVPDYQKKGSSTPVSKPVT